MTQFEAHASFETQDPYDPRKRWGGQLVMKYDSSDPFAVTIVWQANGELVPWVISRELLSASFSHPAGGGDVLVMDDFRTMTSGEPAMTIKLSSPEGNVTSYVSKRMLRLFLNHTYEIVPIGQERLDLDALVEALLT